MRLGLFALFLAISAPATAATTTVAMKNSSGGKLMVFEPAYVQVKPGDTVIFKADDKGHDAESIPSISPAGATVFQGKMSQDISVTFAKPGLYGVKCSPHFGMGMVALVKVGNIAPNAVAARAAAATLPGLAKKTMAALIDRAK